LQGDACLVSVFYKIIESRLAIFRNAGVGLLGFLFRIHESAHCTDVRLRLYTIRMREIQRSALVPYTPAQMFALVDDIERYSEFLPWVAAATLVERSDRERVGRLQMARAGLREQFTTRNIVTPPGRLEMKLVDGPFRVLEGVWTFDPIGEIEAPRGTRVGLNMRFEFASRITDLLLAPKFASSCDTLVDAFAKRALAVYGKTG
jgi:ribosome-associated toxin RatA of RatAB toxin-antitoxin module